MTSFSSDEAYLSAIFMLRHLSIFSILLKYCIHFYLDDLHLILGHLRVSGAICVTIAKVHAVQLSACEFVYECVLVCMTHYVQCVSG